MKKYALIVGVSRYDDPDIGNLNFAAEDAREVGDCLTEICGFDEVRTLVSGGEREPDHISVVEALNRFAPILNPDDLFLFYFAGHGIHTANGSFLLASNSRIRMPELAAVPMPLLQQCLSRLDAAERVLILDACRNDPQKGRGDSDNLLTQEFSRDILSVAKAPCEGVSPATCVLFSCSEGERAYEWADRKHGAFTWYLLDGMRGAALDPQGRLTVQGLSRYVEEHVPRWSRKMALPRPQTPWAQQVGSLREICLFKTFARQSDAVKGNTTLDTSQGDSKTDRLIIPAKPNVRCMTFDAAASYTTSFYEVSYPPCFRLYRWLHSLTNESRTPRVVFALALFVVGIAVLYVISLLPTDAALLTFVVATAVLLGRHWHHWLEFEQAKSKVMLTNCCRSLCDTLLSCDIKILVYQPLSYKHLGWKSVLRKTQVSSIQSRIVSELSTVFAPHEIEVKEDADETEEYAVMEWRIAEWKETEHMRRVSIGMSVTNRDAAAIWTAVLQVNDKT